MVKNTKKIWFYHINLSQKPHFVLHISQLPKIIQKCFCIQNLRMDLSFQEKETVCKSVTWFTSYTIQNNSGVFFETPCTFSHFLLSLHIYFKTFRNYTFGVFQMRDLFTIHSINLFLVHGMHGKFLFS